MSFLNRANTIAPLNYNRWLIPPAALAIHLSIGQIYAYSVFSQPLARIIGIQQPSEGDWSLATIGWIFSIALAVLGASAALFGKWLERVGPRKAMFYSACCFAGGFFLSALGIHFHQIMLIYLGNGVLGGIGLGLGYISPVSTLIKWFPDRPGMATGLAIMGFGGGAILASPLSIALLEHFATPTSVGLVPTFLTLGTLYFIFMMFGVLTIKIPAPNWQPQGYNPKPNQRMISNADISANQAFSTPQFWLLFGVLCLNIIAPSQAYSITMYIMAGLLLVGLILNLLVKPISCKSAPPLTQAPTQPISTEPPPLKPSNISKSLILRWIIVSIPLIYGVVMVFAKILNLFHL